MLTDSVLPKCRGGEGKKGEGWDMKGEGWDKKGEQWS